MNRLKGWAKQLRALFRKEAVERELNEEMRFHIEMETERLAREERLSTEEARRRAIASFGGVERFKEQVREVRWTRSVEDMAADIRHALRVFRRRPGPAASAALTLALGIGVTTALLTLVDHVLVRPLVYGDSERVYSVWGVRGESERRSQQRLQPSYPDFLDWRDAVASIGLAFALGDAVPLRGAEGLELVPTAFVSKGFFDIMRTKPAMGRTFAPEEEETGSPVVVLSHGFWVRRMGADPRPIGQVLTLHQVPHTVVGVMPPGFSWPRWADVWVPVQRAVGAYPELEQRDARVDTRALARVPGHVTEAQAAGRLRAVSARLAELYPDSNEGLSLRLSPLREEVVGNVRSTLLAMLFAAALVLVLACANIASLMLGQASDRSREMALRNVLGASRLRLIRQILTESAVLAGVGGGVGVVFAMVGVDLLSAHAAEATRLAGAPLPRLEELGVDPRALGLASAVTLSAAVLFGVLPALSVSGLRPGARLSGSGHGGTIGAGNVRWQSVLAIAQVTVAVALLTGTGLLVRTLGELREQDFGLRPDRLLVLRIFPPDGYESSDARLALFDRLAEAAAALPGAAGAALVNHMPLAGGLVTTTIVPRDAAASESFTGAAYRTVSPDFFSVAGIRVLRGRVFGASESGAAAVVVNERLADMLWPGGGAVGRHVRITNPVPPSERRGEVFSAEVLGVVGNTKDSPREAARPKVYVPHGLDPWGNITVVVRSQREPAELVAPLRRAVREVDSDIPVANVQLLAERIRTATARERLIAVLMSSFGGLALLLSVVGTYGALSNMVRRRSAEFGVRKALGATEGELRTLVLARHLRILVPGLLLGAFGAILLGRLLRETLYQVPHTDLAVLGIAVGGLSVVALAAGWIPAERAARVDPRTLLRTE